MKDIREWELSLADKIFIINNRLIEVVSSVESHLDSMAKYTIEAGGKRVRPILTLLSYSVAGNGGYEDAIDLAVSNELVHTASLIHDDVMDKSDLRRGRETLFHKYGIYNAIVVGDYLFTKGFELASQYGQEVAKVLAWGASKLAEGQVREYFNMGNLEMSEDTYIRIISDKTANFFAACAKAAAMAGGASKEIQQDMHNFAYQMGLAFQITDDILDIVGDQSETGKPIFNDLKQSTITLPIIYALARDGERGGEFRKILTSNIPAEERNKRIKEALANTGALDYSFERAKYHSEKSIEYLGKTGKSPSLDTLMDLSLLVIDRVSSAF